MFLAKKIYKIMGEKTTIFHFFLQFFTPHAYVNYKIFLASHVLVIRTEV